MVSPFALLSIGLLAVFPIYTGSFASLKRPKSAPKKDHEKDADDDESDFSELLSSGDALLFPIMGGVLLVTLYLVITYVSKEWLNYLFSVYFSLIGVASVTKSISGLIKYIHSEPTKTFTVLKIKSKERKKTLKPARAEGKPDHKKYKKHKKDNVFKLKFDHIDTASFICSLALTVYYSYSKNWIASNILGLSFAHTGIQLLALDSFKTGMILLSGLFFYDIYFVFGTQVMITVAKGLDAPIKLQVPRDALSSAAGYTMLGLGDIVVPGVFVALALRYDLFRHHIRNPDATYSKKANFDTPYFRTVLAAYIFGLAVTEFVMVTYKAAQPALLYLSPACILSVLFLALWRGELVALWLYKEHRDEADQKVAEDRGEGQRQNGQVLKKDMVQTPDRE